MPHHDSPLLGKWEKITASTCSGHYPDQLEFQERGLYVGRNSKPGTFTQWDAGTYEVIDDAHMRLSTANDAVVSYRFALSRDVLTVTDQNNCEFQYRRVR